MAEFEPGEARHSFFSSFMSSDAHLPVETVKKLHLLLGGNVEQEQAILDHIWVTHKARNLFFLLPAIAEKIIARPKAFLKEVRGSDDLLI